MFDGGREQKESEIMNYRCFPTNMLPQGERNSGHGLNVNSMTIHDFPNCPPFPENLDSTQVSLKAVYCNMYETS